MRFVWAVVSFVIAAVLIGAGIAQRTVFLGPTTEQTTVAESVTTPYVLVDGKVLNRLPGAQTLKAQDSGTLFGAYARTSDVAAWLSDTDYTYVSLGDEGEIVSTKVSASVSAPEVTADEQTIIDAGVAAGQVIPQHTSPVGSDLWLAEYGDQDSLIMQLALPEETSVLLATDGVAPAPQEITVSWPVDNSTPWAGPLIVLGVIALVIGVLFYVLGIRHMRRSRGPRRRGVPPMLETQPIDSAAAEKGVISSSRRTRGRRSMIALPVLLVSAVAISGCSADLWPQVDAETPSPTPSQTVVAPEGQQAPVATDTQAERIIARIAETVAAADTSLDANVLANRATGPVFTDRQVNYTLRAKLPEEPALTAIPAAPYKIILPQAIDGWPRTIMAVWQDEADTTVPPQIMLIQQEDAWAPYKLSFMGQMEASAEIPNLPPASIGANIVRQDSSLLAMAPDQLAAAYGDLIDKGEDSEYLDRFNTATDAFLLKIRRGREARVASFNETGAATGSFTFETAPGTEPPIGLQTLHSGAIVAVTLIESDIVKPTVAGAAIRLPNNKRVTTLTGVEESATGFITKFSDQLFFYVPGQGSDEKISLIGFTSNILSSEIIK